jgi:hypothetical protein
VQTGSIGVDEAASGGGHLMDYEKLVAELRDWLPPEDGVQINGDGEITYPIWCGHLTPGDFGKTVFLTREEAEAALRREQDG